MSSKGWVGLVCCAFWYLLCSPALAQTNIQFPPNCCQIGPTGAQVAGAVIGAAVVIGVIVYFAVPKQTTIEGCVTSSDGTPTDAFFLLNGGLRQGIAAWTLPQIT